MSFTGASKKNENIIIPDSDFWPGFETNDFRTQMRILDSIQNEQVVFVLTQAIDSVIEDLEEFENQYKSDTVTRLDEVPMKTIAGVHRGVLKFKRAVYSEAKALALETYRDMDLTRKAGQDHAEKEEAYIRELRRDSISAIRELLGSPPVFVELV